MTFPEQVTSFCLENPTADAIHCAAVEGPAGGVRDIAEFRTDHGDDRPDAVAEWALAAQGDRVELSVLRKTGERMPDGEVWERVGLPLEVLR